jgi:anti-anti-sigma regulatory factor
MNELKVALWLHLGPRATQDHLRMTFRIERMQDGPAATIRLIGRIQAEHLEELAAQIASSGAGITFDLEEVTLVDVDVVRFLASCRAKGIVLVNCSPYIDEWIAKEASIDS